MNFIEFLNKHFNLKGHYFKIIGFVFVLCALSSCIVRSPKYTSLAQVMELKLGMTKTEVEEKLGVKPYNLKSSNDTSDVFIYVYRLIDRQTLSIHTAPVNGRETEGRYIQLAVAYSKDAKIINIESCTLCPDDLESVNKIDFSKILAFFTVTMPVILVYIGLKN
jgi:hypothetical protein